ncbi:amino acid permease-domain-containing protein [Cladorrhinum sp. PSN332]|nr:amino acid permease-domain-containing protein [Cladorrhinum sp. PSN332]
MADQPAMGGYAYPIYPSAQSQGDLNPQQHGDYYHGGHTPSTEKRTDVVSVHSEAPNTELRRTLKERHVNMIGFSMVLGVGLFLSSGKAIFIAGPGLTVIAYLFMGTIMWSAMASMAEMTALYPVKGPTFEFARRFIDDSVGYASAWMLWFGYVMVAAAEIQAITEIFKFRVKPEYLADVGYPEGTTMQWDFGLETNPAVWIGIFLLVELVVNLLPVREYGRIEYVFGCIKISFLVILILINTIIHSRGRYHHKFWTYKEPYGFSSHNMTVKAPNPSIPEHQGVVYTGSLGTFAALWTCMVTSFFSLQGWDVILLTAPENKDLARDETMKISSRKIALRVIILYSLAVFTVGLNVPYNDASLRDLTINSIKGGHGSAFVIAAIREHVPVLPHFLNGFFVFSAATTGINSLYSASRLLHAISTLRDAWPHWGWTEAIRSRLEQTRLGVPMTAVFVSWVLAFVAFMSVNPDSDVALANMTNFSSGCTLIVYILNCVTFLKFFKELNLAACGARDEDLDITPDIRYQWNRGNKKHYPYRSHLQWLRALYALVMCVLLLMFQGWRSFVSPMDKEGFVAAYIAIPIFLLLSAAYFVKTRGFSPSRWYIRAEKLSGLEAVGPVVVPDPNSRDPCRNCGMKHRRGALAWPKGQGTGQQKTMAILEWVWAWLK